MAQATYRSGWRLKRPNLDVDVDVDVDDCSVGVADGKLCGLGAAGGEAGGEELETSGDADISGGKNGFNLSNETVQGLPAFNKTNVLSLLCSTL